MKVISMFIFFILHLCWVNIYSQSNILNIVNENQVGDFELKTCYNSNFARVASTDKTSVKEVLVNEDKLLEVESFVKNKNSRSVYYFQDAANSSLFSLTILNYSTSLSELSTKTQLIIEGRTINGESISPALFFNGQSLGGRNGFIDMGSIPAESILMLFSEPISQISMQLDGNKGISILNYSIYPCPVLDGLNSLNLQKSNLCKAKKILFALDASKSMNKEKAETAKVAILEMLNAISINMPDCKIGFAEFAQDAQLKMRVNTFNSEDLKGEGKIESYLKVFCHSAEERQSNSSSLLTGWEEILKLSKNLKERDDIDAIVIISDGYPNTDGSKKIGNFKALFNCMPYLKQFADDEFPVYLMAPTLEIQQQFNVLFNFLDINPQNQNQAVNTIPNSSQLVLDCFKSNPKDSNIPKVSIELSPNPAADEVILNLELEEIDSESGKELVQALITDLAGRRVFGPIVLQNKVTSINTSQLSAGSYLISFNINQ